MRLCAVVLVWAAATALVEAAGPDALSGRWSGGGFELHLDAGGTGSLQDSPASPPEAIRWRAAGGRLTVTQDGEDVRYDYALDGDRLRLRGGDLEQPVTLSRTGAGGAGRPATSRTATKLGRCETSCRHYLTCGRGFTPDVEAACVAECQRVGYGPAFLGWFESTDCATAIAVIDALDRQQRGLQSGAGGTGGRSCQGCVWDGSLCSWYSRSDWGPGAYSGAVVSCDASCCPR